MYADDIINYGEQLRPAIQEILIEEGLQPNSELLNFVLEEVIYPHLQEKFHLIKKGGVAEIFLEEAENLIEMIIKKGTLYSLYQKDLIDFIVDDDGEKIWYPTTKGIETNKNS